MFFPTLYISNTITVRFQFGECDLNVLIVLECTHVSESKFDLSTLWLLNIYFLISNLNCFLIISYKLIWIDLNCKSILPYFSLLEKFLPENFIPKIQNLRLEIPILGQFRSKIEILSTYNPPIPLQHFVWPTTPLFNDAWSYKPNKWNLTKYFPLTHFEHFWLGVVHVEFVDNSVEYSSRHLVDDCIIGFAGAASSLLWLHVQNS